MRRIQIWQLALLVGSAAANPPTAAEEPPHHTYHTRDHTHHQQLGGPKPHSRSLETAEDLRSAHVAAINSLKGLQYIGEVYGFEKAYPGVLEQSFELASSHLGEEKDAHKMEELQMLQDEVAQYKAAGDDSWTNDHSR